MAMRILSSRMTVMLWYTAHMARLITWENSSDRQFTSNSSSSLVFLS